MGRVQGVLYNSLDGLCRNRNFCAGADGSDSPVVQIIGDLVDGLALQPRIDAGIFKAQFRAAPDLRHMAQAIGLIVRGVQRHCGNHRCDIFRQTFGNLQFIIGTVATSLQDDASTAKFRYCRGGLAEV